MDDTSLYINLENLRNNINLIKSLEHAKNKTIIAIIKSDAYGHGLVASAETLFNTGIKFFGIIGIDEAKKILKKLPNAGLLMLKGIPEGDIAEALRLNLKISVISLDYLNMLLSKAKKLNKTANIHLKFDSGMGRLGFSCDELKSAICIINENKKYINAEGLFSHLSSGGDTAYSNFQIGNFRKILSILNKNKIFPEFVHISASSSILNGKIEDDCSNSVRPGIMLYGINPNGCVSSAPHGAADSAGYADIFSGVGAGLKPVMSLKSKVLQVKKIKKGAFVSYGNTFKAGRDSMIAVVSAGYDNGIPRLLSNKGRFLINGKFAPITGIVTMNMTMVDITEIEGVKPGDEAVIAGKSGLNEITLSEIASTAETIPYEICLNFGKSNKRIYLQ
jgi:alanine racemase